MNRTKIEWVRNPDGSQGYTWNPITGCLNHTPEGLCLGGMFPCYAYKLAYGRLRKLYLANRNFVYCGQGSGINPDKDPFYPRFWQSRIYQPMEHKKPIGIFLVDMGELFALWLPDDWIAQVMAVIKACPQHRFYLLTKQPQNLIKFSPFPENCWVGVTATSNLPFLEALGHLTRIEAKIKYLSCEPLLYPVDAQSFEIMKGADIDWVIIGAQTKPYKPPKIEWVDEIVRAADKAGIPVFLKDNLWPLFDANRPWPPMTVQNGRLRQEMPE